VERLRRFSGGMEVISRIEREGKRRRFTVGSRWVIILRDLGVFKLLDFLGDNPLMDPLAVLGLSST